MWVRFSLIALKNYMLFQNKLIFSKFSLVEHKVTGHKFEIGDTINMNSHSRSVKLIFQMVYSEVKIAYVPQTIFRYKDYGIAKENV